MSDIKVGDKVAAAVTQGSGSDLRVGVVDKIHPATKHFPLRYTIRDDMGRPTIAAASRTVAIERDLYHTMDELYHYRALYNAAAACFWHNIGIHVVKSRRHSDGEEWDGLFIVSAQLPTGQVSNHYRNDLWNLFDIPEEELAPPWDGHTPQMAAARLEAWLMTFGR